MRAVGRAAVKGALAAMGEARAVGAEVRGVVGVDSAEGEAAARGAREPRGPPRIYRGRTSWFRPEWVLGAEAGAVGVTAAKEAASVVSSTC